MTSPLPHERQELLAAIFQCTRCGFCCQGETTVSLNDDDQRRMVDELGLSPAATREKFWRVTGHEVQMRVEQGHCIFFQAEGGCSVHRGRPWRCAQWPLHPSILADEANFIAIRDSCPGINPDLNYDEFCVILRRLLDETGRLAC